MEWLTQTITLQKIETKTTYCFIEQISFCWLFAFIHSANLCDGFKTLRFYFRTQDDQKLHQTEEKQRRKRSSTTHLDEETLASIGSSKGNQRGTTKLQFKYFLPGIIDWKVSSKIFLVYIERSNFNQSYRGIHVTWSEVQLKANSNICYFVFF